MPLLGRALPSKRQHAVQLLAPPRRLVAHQREVRNHRKQQEQEAAGEIGVDREEVPHERRAEVRPDQPLTRVRHEPEEQPRTSEMDDREQRADHQREYRDDFRATRHRPAPPCVHEAQNRGDERARVTDADPEHEVRDVEGPVHRHVDAGETEPHVHLVEPRPEPHRDDAAEDGDEEPEFPRRRHDGTQEIVADALGERFVHACGRFR